MINISSIDIYVSLCTCDVHFYAHNSILYAGLFDELQAIQLKTSKDVCWKSTL